MAVADAHHAEDAEDAVLLRETPAAGAPLARPGWRFLLRHPAHLMALGFGSGLAPRAPGTVGTLWAWAAFLVASIWLSPAAWGWVIAATLPLGVWACTRTAQAMAVADPGAIVWDEVIAFWIVLWVLMPAPLWVQALAFGLFRWFDAAKPGPVRWADQLFKRQPDRPIGWAQGWGIVFDDLVAALCTLLVLAIGVRLWNF